MAVSKSDNPWCELRIGDVKSKQVWKFTLSGTNGKCGREILRPIRILKDTF